MNASTLARLRRVFAAPALGAIAALAIAGSVDAHGTDLLPEPAPADAILRWSFDPTVQLPLIATAVLWILAVRRVNRAHPANPVPRRRTVALLTGLFVVEVALQSGIEAYDTTLFAVHMIQHILLIMVAAPLLALAAPITLLLRVATPTWRQRLVLPVLHSRLVRLVSHPVIAWLLFAGVMWGTHFSPVFDVSLENPLVHDAEHLAYLVTALLFWWPATGVDPSPWRLPHPARTLYVFLQMPQNTFLSLTLYSAAAPLYAHYVTLQRDWGPTPLADQQLAAGLMWVTGDLMLLLSVLLVVLDWMRHEERETVRLDARLDAERAAIRERERALAERHANAAAFGSSVPRLAAATDDPPTDSAGSRTGTAG